jgi:peroxiredoxin (alkyl hydroperoxide reductase subunit C)
MTIQAGQKLPSARFKCVTAEGVKDMTTEELFGGKKVVLFALPGAFTPTCSAKHLPGYVEQADAILAKGADRIVCLSVNDSFVMGAWAKDRGVDLKKIIMLADGNAELTRALGLELDGSGFGMGLRAQRFAMIVEDGVVKKLNVEKPMKFEVSDAATILAAL